MNKTKVAVAMSGGVDSSAAAALLLEQGYDVVGFSMQLWNHRSSGGGAETEPERFGSCCSIDDLYDARKVASRLSIPYYVVNFEREFLATVVRPFVSGYLRGETPSPCVLCNTHLKFDRLMQFSRQVNADFVATGHYAGVRFDPETQRYQLLRGADPAKDQSYFLFELNQEQLSRAWFPLRDLSKDQVREYARRGGLSVADKADSQEICFVGGSRYTEFIDAHRAEILDEAVPESAGAGAIVDESGRVLGTHRGVHHYTIGQRRGLGIAAAFPLYVIGIDVVDNRVVVGPEESLAARRLLAHTLNWIVVDALKGPTRATAKIRSRASEAPVTLLPREDGRLCVEFDEPIRAVTPGQAVVFYQDALVLGGGWIDRELP